MDTSDHPVLAGLDYELCDAPRCALEADWMTTHDTGKLYWCDHHHFQLVTMGHTVGSRPDAEHMPKHAKGQDGLRR